MTYLYISYYISKFHWNNRHNMSQHLSSCQAAVLFPGFSGLAPWPAGSSAQGMPCFPWMAWPSAACHLESMWVADALRCNLNTWKLRKLNTASSEQPGKIVCGLDLFAFFMVSLPTSYPIFLRQRFFGFHCNAQCIEISLKGIRIVKFGW